MYIWCFKINNKYVWCSISTNFQVYIRDQPFDPCHFFALGNPCPVICTKETKGTVHSQYSCQVDCANSEVRCSRNHHWLHKKTIADVVEALVGAFIVDRGFKGATAFLRWIGIRVDFQGSQVNNVCAASKRFMPLCSKVDTEALETLLGYQFLHQGLLLQAFVHPSHNTHGGGCYQVCTTSYFLLKVFRLVCSFVSYLSPDSSVSITFYFPMPQLVMLPYFTRDWSFLEMLSWIM